MIVRSVALRRGGAFAPPTPVSPYPQVQGVAITTVEVSGRAHPVNLPAGVQAGELLLTIVRASGANVGISPPEGWTEVAFRTSSGSSVIAVREADGTEGPTAAFSTNGDRTSAAVTYRISGYQGAPAAGYRNVSFTRHPPSLTPPWGEAATLWLVAVSNAAGGLAEPVPPSGYGDLVFATSANSATVAVASREATAATEQPDQFTGNWTGHAATIAVRPG